MDTNTAVPQGSTPRTQPESFRGRSLAASLTVSDLQRSLTFYRDVVGFTVDRKFEREGRLAAVALKAGAVELLLGQDDGAKGEGRVKGEGFSLQITTSQDVDALAKRIQDRGGLLTTEPADVWGARVFRMQDPDGFRLTISSQRS
jgi:predicted enzyme related to lactoylglutathione lyase